MAQSIKKNFLYNILLNISSVVFPLITAPYVARVLEPDGVGLYNFSSTYAGYFSLVAVLGIPTYGVREVSKARDNVEHLTKLVSQLMSITTITSLVVSIIYVLTILFVGQFSENFLIFILAGFVIYLAPIKVNWYYQGLEQFGFITFRSLVIRIISVICLFIFVHQKNDLIIYVILNVLGGVVADIWNCTKMRKTGIRPYLTFDGILPHFKPLLILFASSVAISIYTVLDTLMLGFLTDYDEVGFYTNAIHISKLILIALASLSLVAVPRISHYMKKKEYDNISNLVNRSFSVIAFLSVPTTIGMVCIAPTFIPLFFGVKFVGSIIPLMILSFLIIIMGLNNLSGVQILTGMGYDKLLLYSVILGAATNIVLNTALIPIWGAVGASVASVVAEFVILLITTYFVYHKTPIRIVKWNEIYKACFGSLFFIPLFLFLKRFCSGWLLIFIFVLSGCAIYLLIETLLRSESVSLFKMVLINKLKRN